MLRCGKCGRDNAEGMRFCTNCGALLETEPAGDEIDSSQPPETISFSTPPPTSPTAGWPTAGAYLPPQPPVSKGRDNNTGLIIGIAAVLLVGVLVVAGGVGWYVYSNSGPEVANRNTNNRNDATPSPSPANTNANTRPSPSPSPSPSNKSFDPPTAPTKEGSFTVYANEGWQLSEIAVVPYEKYTTKAEGLVDLAGAKAGIRAGGDKDAKLKSRRLFAEYPTGALLMRTRYADGRFSNTVAAGTNGAWENLPDERGMLEFAINDNAPKDNGGQFTIRVKMTSVPKNK
ncbi:MAG: zinc ribbon domain-containing protein [Pyrinomonadaceae bacterium]